MKPVSELLAELGAAGIKFTIDGERLHVNAPKGTLTPELRAELVQRKPEIVAFLGEVGFRPETGSAPIQPVSRVGPQPASFAQQRLWFLDQLEPDSSAYNVVAAYRLTGALDLTALERAINEVVRRHEVLRTTFAAADGEPVQVIARSLHLSLPVVDLEVLPRAEREAEALRLAAEYGQDLFDLSQGPLLRARLMRLGAKEHILVLVQHHIVTDGWSAGVFRRELGELYTAFSQGRLSPLPELPVQYADFAVWQRERLEAGALEGELAYWRERLEGATQVHVPGDRPRPALMTYDGSRLGLSLSPETSRALKALSRREGVTLFMTLLAAFKVLLYRYTGQEDVVVGSPIANRDRAEIEGLIGFFVNTLALRTDLSGAASGALTFRELLARVREVCLGSYAHQQIPFEKLVEELQPDRDLSRNPLFQVLFVLQNAPHRTMEMGGLTATRLTLETNRVRFDLECHLREEGEGIQGTLIYSTSLFDAATIARMAGHYEMLLEGLVADPDRRIHEITLLPESEWRKVVVEWNATQVARSPGETVVDLFERRVLCVPEAVACVMDGQEMTYGRLNAWANQVAQHLQGRGVGPEDVVGLCCSRSLEAMVGLVGILKSGAAYVPLDPAHPRERLGFMLRDSCASVLLTEGALVNRLPESDAEVICLDSEWEAIAEESDEKPARGAGPGNLAYILYTSGSTGKPKGVGMVHKALHNLIAWQLPNSAVCQGAKTLQFTPLTFDVSFQEIFATWCAGGTLVLISEELRRDPFALLRFIETESVERLFLPFTALQQLGLAAGSLDTLLGSLREVITAGEQVQTTPQLMRLFERLPDCRLYNHYGPTEAHVVTAYSLEGPPEDWPALPPIGRPIANTQIYVLDQHLEPAPVGIPGELYIGGSALARGYHGRPGLVAVRFIPHPLSDEPGARLYRTGDVARWLADGNIEFLGRTDHQVKIRGFRIELGEVESVLEQHPAVQQATVVARDDLPVGRGLVAYIVVGQGDIPAIKALRSYVRERLPGYMEPSVFLPLESLPLTPSGKVDLQALPAPSGEIQTDKATFAAPRDEVERQLVQIWEQLLGVQPVGICDDFFDLGGHSLLGIRLFARIDSEMGKKLPVALLFESPTVEGLAQAIRGGGAPPDWSTLVPIQAGGSRPPFFCVHGFGGGVLGYAELARQLGPDQPFYGLQAKGLNGREEPDARIEDMASRYLQAMRSIQPQGPYHLGGYCYGAVVAFEMARQLRARGEEVALLAILEGYVPKRFGSADQFPRLQVAARTVVNLPYWLRDALQRPGGYVRIWTRIRSRLGTNHRPHDWDPRLPLDIAADIGDEPDVPEYHRQLMAVHWQALRDYHPQAYPGRVTLFRVRGLALSRSYDPEMGWGALAGGGVDVKMIAGAHHSFLEQPHVQVLAAQLTESLQDAQSDGSLLWTAAQDNVEP